jgi:serine/threonine-protein kinase
MRIGSYDVLCELGRGGMGAVYLARLSGEGAFERLVAIKRALPLAITEADAHGRFLHEARLAASVHHANVVGIHHVGSDEVGPYLACDYVEGESLAGLIERTRQATPIAPAIAVRIVLDALSGLCAVHDAQGGDGLPLGILHRDVSIENLLVGRDGVTRITDFGIAKSAVSPVQTEAGTIHGKLVYLTPEYLQGGPPDRSCDTYGMGVTLFAALTSSYPYYEQDARALVEQICNGAWPSLTSRGVHLPDALERVVARACERDPARRYADAPSMLEDLEQAARSTTGVARQQEVAAFVERVAGPDLARRRALVRARRSLSPAVLLPAGETAPLALKEPVSHATEAQVAPPARTLAGRDLWAVGAALLALLLGMLGHRYLTADFGDKRRVEASPPTPLDPPQSARPATPPPLPSTAGSGAHVEPSANPAAGAAEGASALDAGTQSRARSVRRAEATLEKPRPTPPARQSAPGVAEGMLPEEPALPSALPVPVPADGSGISKQNPYR